MPADFLDTNVLVYAYDPTDRRKQEVAQGLLKKALVGEMTISGQVLAEFAATLFHKLSPPAPPESLRIVLDALGPIRLLPTDGEMVRRAVEVRAAYGLHFYDALIVAAAERAECVRIWSEDLNAGQKYFGVQVENPFAAGL
jgi:predicted nucleic acid-binding protein